MRIAHINSTDNAGGAAKAALRLCEGLIQLEPNLRFFVKRKHSNAHFISTIHHPFALASVLAGAYYEKIPTHSSTSSKKYYFHQVSPLGGIFIRELNQWLPDIVHLHQINYGTLALAKINSIKKPIFWTLHDLWPITGGCHYPFSCTHYESNCGGCHLLNSQDENDASRTQFKLKQSIYQETPITFIAPSQWILKQAKKSPLTINQRLVHIPNGINTQVFHPLNKRLMRLKHQLPLDKKILLFIAHHPLDERKGFKYLKEALALLKEKNIFLLIIGNNKNFTPQLPCPWRIINHQETNDSLVELINCADISITPSQEDNLPNVILESMSCGIPVVAFNIGGIPEMITDDVDGLLTENTSIALSKAIDLLLSNSHLSGKMSQEARLTITKRFTQEKQASTHLELYETILKQQQTVNRS